MDHIWTPWRYAYITGKNRESGCVFCNKLQGKDDRQSYVVYRGKHCFICLNAFPYSSGHVMVVPYQHVAELRELASDAAFEMMILAQRLDGILHNLYRPDGLNLGMNLGKAAGAGVAEHLHLHVLPRWIGDASFISVIGETRVLPESLETTWERISEALRD